WREAVADLDHHYNEHPILCALHDTIQHTSIPLHYFTDLLRAFEQDLKVSRYETLADLLDYCRYSADPIGRIVLHLYDIRDESLYPLSDAVCTGLQLVNFLQDVLPDAKRGRIYLPLEWVRSAGIEQAILDGNYSPAWLPPHKQLAAEAEYRLQRGRRLLESVPRRLRLDLRLFIGGGEAALKKVRRCAFNPSVRHHLNGLEKTVVALRAIFW
ncbi:MAG: squalene/phytoene synthase family protein, partial [Pirellulales bacterium]|nr:squalene/phytoene synthase family protein [Pirellulales bacterium]